MLLGGCGVHMILHGFTHSDNRSIDSVRKHARTHRGCSYALSYSPAMHDGALRKVRVIIVQFVATMPRAYTCLPVRGGWELPSACAQYTIEGNAKERQVLRVPQEG